MNAYELADSVDGWAEDVYGGGEQLKDAANMLRQQADRIAELEEAFSTPALWASPKTAIHGIVDARAYPLEGFIPLYLPLKVKAWTTPQTKPLSDKEIFQIGEKLRIATTEIEGNWFPVVAEFARAIEERHGIK